MQTENVLRDEDMLILRDISACQRIGKDTIIALATIEDEVPYVRYVDAYYEDGAFYTITYALSNKMKHIESDPIVAIAGEWFTGHGKGVSLGYFGKLDNAEIAGKLKKAFSVASIFERSSTPEFFAILLV